MIRGFLGRLAAALTTAALSAAGGLLLVYGPLEEEWNVPLQIMAMGLVAAATVIGTLWSWKGIGLALGAPPLSIIAWVAAIREADADPFWVAAGLYFMLLAFAVSAASWYLVLAATRKHRKGVVRPDAT